MIWLLLVQIIKLCGGKWITIQSAPLLLLSIYIFRVICSTNVRRVCVCFDLTSCICSMFVCFVFFFLVVRRKSSISVVHSIHSAEIYTALYSSHCRILFTAGADRYVLLRTTTNIMDGALAFDPLPVACCLLLFFLCFHCRRLVGWDLARNSATVNHKFEDRVSHVCQNPVDSNILLVRFVQCSFFFSFGKTKQPTEPNQRLLPPANAHIILLLQFRCQTRSNAHVWSAPTGRSC